MSRWRKYVRGRGGKVEKVCKREGWQGGQVFKGEGGKVEKVCKRVG